MIHSKKTQKIIATVLVFVLGFVWVPIAKAASLTSVSEVMSREAASTASDHTIQFTTNTAIGSGSTITVVFPAGFTMGSVAYGDMDLRDNTSSTDYTLVASGQTGSQWGAAVASQTVTFTAGASVSIATGHVMIIKIGLNATVGGTGTHQVTNPTAGTYVFSITSAGDTGSFAVAIVSNDQVSVSATVATSITFSITGGSSVTFNNNPLSTASVNTGTQTTLQVASNTATGYTVSVRDQGNGTNGGMLNGSYLVQSATATLAGGAEGYGIQASSATGATIASAYNKSSNDVGALTVAAQTVASRAAANTSNDTITISHLLTISGYTKAGNYSDTITYVATGNY